MTTVVDLLRRVEARDIAAGYDEKFTVAVEE
jgi:hypothetical protein